MIIIIIALLYEKQKAIILDHSFGHSLPNSHYLSLQNKGWLLIIWWCLSIPPRFLRFSQFNISHTPPWVPCQMNPLWLPQNYTLVNAWKTELTLLIWQKPQPPPRKEDDFSITTSVLCNILCATSTDHHDDLPLSILLFQKWFLANHRMLLFLISTTHSCYLHRNNDLIQESCG